jgi:hypothetical protein
MRWDLTGQGTVTTSDLRLLVDTDNDGLFNDETPISGATSSGGNVYQFAGVTAITNGRRFTLGTASISQTPLPVTLTSFEATAVQGKVKLNWVTASETNNDYFEIQRSTNGALWENLNKVKGSGNSNTKVNYEATDELPMLGTSYYRLKQVDYDGVYEYSVVESVNIARQNTIFPNPTVGNVILTSDDDNLNLDQILVFSASGKSVNDKVVIKVLSGTQLEIDLSSLPSGLYLIKTKTGSVSVEKK